MRNAMLMAQQAELYRKKGKPRIGVEKFMPDFGGDRQKRRRARKEQSMAQMEMALYAQYLAMGGEPKD
jgi:hypothetical protein